jgi:hypothetical protein
LNHLSKEITNHVPHPWLHSSVQPSNQGDPPTLTHSSEGTINHAPPPPWLHSSGQPYNQGNPATLNHSSAGTINQVPYARWMQHSVMPSTSYSSTMYDHQGRTSLYGSGVPSHAPSMQSQNIATPGYQHAYSHSDSIQASMQTACNP